MTVLIPLVVAGGSYVAYKRHKRMKKGMTPQRKDIFEKALKTMTDPAQLRKLADSYEKEGLKAEAVELRKRAAIREAPTAVKEQRKEAFKKGMSSTDPTKIRSLADAFHRMGYYMNADALRKYARGLIDRTNVTSTKA